MPRIDTLFSAALIVLTLAGCASSRPISELPQTLEQVNQNLEGRWVIIELVDGSLLKHAEDVHIAADTTEYFDQHEQVRKAIATGVVHRVRLRTTGGAKQGARRGALPGLAILGVTVIEAIKTRDSDSLGYEVGIGLIIGIPLTLGGSFVGGILGGATDRGELVYEGPVGVW